MNPLCHGKKGIKALQCSSLLMILRSSRIILVQVPIAILNLNLTGKVRIRFFEWPRQKNNQYKVQDGNESDSASIDTIFCEIEEDTHKQAMEEQDEVLSPTTNLKLPPAVFVPSTRSRGKGTREKSSVAAQKERKLAATLEKKKNTQTRQKAKRLMATGGEPRISVRLKIAMSE